MHSDKSKDGSTVYGLILIGAFFLVWILLQAVILPRLGVPT